MINGFPDQVDLYSPNTAEESLHKLLYGLVKFINILRRQGTRVSVSETRDALDALSQVDILDREQVKVALSATLVKNYHDRNTFNKAFDDFFSTSEIKMQGPELTGEGYAGEGTRPEQAGDGPAPANKDAERDWGKEFLDHARQAVEQNEKLSIKPGWTKRQKKQFIETISRMRGDSGSPGTSAPLARKAEKSLDLWHEEVKKQVEQSGVASPQNFNSSIKEKLSDTYASLVSGPGARSDDESILFADMKKISDKDLPRVILLIKKLSRRLATRISRRYYRKRRRGRLDIRRTIRKNISFGGALIDLKYQSKKEQKPRLVLICDVSGSMARYAVFVIQFIYGLSSVVKGIESFIFSEDLERVTSHFKKGDSFVKTMSSLVEKSNQWGLGTNLHASLDTFLEKHHRLLSPSVFVIIVSDAQTIQAYQTTSDLKEIRSRVKDIIWLNTMPRADWQWALEINEFQKYCRMFECSTLDQLSNVLGNQVLTV
ncbi:MAG: VWA domain-containing protein [Desulfotomaculaceae bacterium]